ncbi:MAG: GNAT family N-acetyltransferase [Anaerolineae bacterium]
MMNLRRATADDAPALARVHVDSWQVAYRGIVPESHLERFTYAWRERAFRKALSDNSEETYLLQDEEQPVAILTIGASRDDDLDTQAVGELWGIYITPDYWRRGIGTTLVREAERMLHARGCTAVVLWVLADNHDARRFYEKMGYAADGVSKTVTLGQPLSAVRYHKMLTAS